MSDLEILSEMMLDSVFIPLENEYGKPVIKLQEEGVKGSISYIKNIPFDAVVIKADEFPSPKDKFFKSNNGECKRADFIVISEEKKVILYIEIKAGKKNKKYIVNQLKGAYCVMSYCKEIGRLFWENEKFLDGYSHRFVGIVELSISKKPTREFNKLPLHDSPESFLRISSPRNLQFKHLAAI